MEDNKFPPMPTQAATAALLAPSAGLNFRTAAERCVCVYVWILYDRIAQRTELRAEFLYVYNRAGKKEGEGKMWHKRCSEIFWCSKRRHYNHNKT